MPNPLRIQSNDNTPQSPHVPIAKAAREIWDYIENETNPISEIQNFVEIKVMEVLEQELSVASIQDEDEVSNRKLHFKKNLRVKKYLLLSIMINAMAQIYKEKRVRTRPRFLDNYQNWIEECIAEAVQRNRKIEKIAELLENLLDEEIAPLSLLSGIKTGQWKNIRERIESGLMTAIEIIKIISWIIPEIVKRDLNKDLIHEERQEILKGAYSIIFKIAMVDMVEIFSIGNKLANETRAKKYFGAVERKGKISIIATDDFWKNNIQFRGNFFSPHMGCPAHVNFDGESFIKMVFEEY